MPGRHGHVQLLNGKAKACQAYPPRLERAIVDGLVEQLTSDRILKPGFAGALEPEEDLHEQLPETPWNEGADVPAQESEDIFINDVSGCRLDPIKMRQARAEELQEVHRFGVYVEAPIGEAIRVTGRKPIGSRWSDINKGDEKAPKYWSRLCAKVFRASDPQKAGCFAATPPLEALKLLLSMCMSEWDNDLDRGRTKRGKWKVMFMDATRAHFHSAVREAIYVDLPHEESRPSYVLRTTCEVDVWHEASSSELGSLLRRGSQRRRVCKEHRTRVCSYTQSVVYGFGCMATTLSCSGFMMT